MTNALKRTAVVEAIKCGSDTRQVDILVPSQQRADIELLGAEVDQKVTLQFSVRCLADLVVPRTVSAVRHAGKRDKLSLDTLLGLDELSPLPWAKRLIGEQKALSRLVDLIGNALDGK